MTLVCPLCGNNKSEDSLFCEQCSKKINSDFEIDFFKEEKSDASGEYDTPEVISNSDISEKLKDKEYQTVSIETETVQYEDEREVERISGKGKRVLVPLFGVFATAVLLLVAFFIYNKAVRSGNLERRAWETAVVENSVSGYLTYIESHPDGIHFDDAREAIMKLKEEEAALWERIKVSDNLEELINFSNQYETSPYMPLVRNRIDSLSWVSALKMNSAESYSEYMVNAQAGLINGDYIYEASKRYEMLFQSFPVNTSELENIRTTVNGFYASLSDINHTGMFNYLAPEVHRFFDSGYSTRERITGDLVVTAAQASGRRIYFEANLEGLMYEREINGFYKVNIPVVKSYTESGSRVYMPGYIAHLELNTNFEIRSIYETKPFHGAP